MKSIDNILNAIMGNFYHLTPWLLRLGLGISFIFHGLNKFPLPPQKLIDYFGFSAELASFVAISELGAGILLILGGFLKGYVGNLVTRFAAGIIDKPLYVSPSIRSASGLTFSINSSDFLITSATSLP